MTAVEFLKKFHPDGYWVLHAFKPGQKGIATMTFTPDQADEAQAWIDARVGKYNLYFMVNQPHGPLTKKATKTDVATAHWFHVDIDARVGEPLANELVRIKAAVDNYTPRPSVVVFTGGGYHAFWRLAQPIEAKDPGAIEPYNQQLEYELEGDSCHNIDRIMRLPGTINLPTAKKLARGREPVEATTCWFEDRSYELTDFKPAGAPTEVLITKPEQIADLDALDKWKVPNRVKVIIVQGEHPDEVKQGDTSRSAWLFDVVRRLIECGVPDKIIAGVILDPGYGISASVLDKAPRELDYATRQIQRAHDLGLDFKRSKNKAILNCLANVEIAMRKLDCTLTYDQFIMRTRIDGAILDDKVLIDLWGRVEMETDWTPPWDPFNRYLRILAHASPVHPVREYLDSRTWDGTGRIDNWLVTYAGAEDTAYCHAVGRLVLLAAVRRVRHPGCKFDEMLVLESTQGMNKSSALACLAVNDEWFTDDLPLGDDTKRQMEAIVGKWIVEAGELAGMKKADVDKLKTFLSRPIDEARMAYARETTRAARQCVIIGTTNNDRYLKDHTGNRRYWPVAVQAFDLDALRRDRDQLWAEAAKAESEGESIRLDPSLYPASGAEQEKRFQKHEYLELLEELFVDIDQGQIPADVVREALDINPGRCTPQQNTNMGQAMKALGWERTQARVDGKLKRVYRKGEMTKPIYRYHEGHFVSEVPF